MWSGKACVVVLAEPRRQRAARVATEAGAPVVVLVLAPLAIALHSSSTLLAGMAWGCLAALFFGVIPFGYVLFGMRNGHWGDRHIRNRRQRRPVFVASLASMTVGLLLLALLGAPHDLTAFLLILALEAVAALAVTLVWKVSIHAWVSTIGATALVLTYGPWALPLWPLLVAVGWSRVELRDHTTAQVLVGVALGLLLTATLFPVLR